MPKNRLYKFLSRVADIRPGEEYICLLLFFYFFLITFPHTIIKSLRYAKILKQSGVNALPPAYLLAAIITGLIVILHSRIQVKASKQVLIVASLIFFISTGFFFWLLLPTGGTWFSIAYWVWATVLIVVLLTHFWITANEALNPREAKRLIGFFGSGGILGGVFGGLITNFLAKSHFSNYLLPIACVSLFGCIFIVRAIYSGTKKAHFPGEGSGLERISRAEAPPVGILDKFKSVLKNRYLNYIALAVAVTIMVGTLIDFQFSSIIESHFAGEDDLKAFYGLFLSGLTFFAFFLQLLMTSNIMKKFGVKRTLLFAPLVLLTCTVGLIFIPGLIIAILLKGNEESLSFSLNQSVREILYIPVAPELRFKAKIFIDMFLNRFAKGICALFLMVAIYLHFDSRIISVIIILFLLFWLLLNIKISREYVSAVKQNIQLKWARADKDIEEKLDVDYTKLVFDAIESRGRSSELYAMHVFDLLRQNKLSPEVKGIIAQKTQDAKAPSIGDMFEAEGAAWVSGEEEAIDETALTTDINEIMALDSYQQLMRRHADEVLEKSKEAEIEKMELAKAIGLMKPDAPMVDRLEALILDPNAEVSRYAIESAGKLLISDHIPSLIRKLSDPLTREDSAVALKKYGDEAASSLAVIMLDSRKNADLRHAAANVLSRIATQAAADSLLKQLEKKSEDMDNQVIEALDKIRSENPSVPISFRIVKRKLLFHIRMYYQEYLDWEEKANEIPTENGIKAQERRLSDILDNIFKMLGLVYPHEDIVKASQNIKTGTKHSVAYAIELLDNTLRKEFRDLILPLIDDIPPAEKARCFRQHLKTLPQR